MFDKKTILMSFMGAVEFFYLAWFGFRNYLSCFIMMLLLLPGTSFSAPEARHQQLDNLQQKIKQIKTHLNKGIKQRLDYQHQLEIAEVAKGHLAIKLHRTQQQLHSTKDSLGYLRTQADSLRVSLQQRKQRLAKQLRQMYMLGQPSYIQIILEQQDPAQIARIMTYYQALQSAQQRAIDQVESVLAEVATNRQQTKTQVKQLQDLHKVLQDQRLDKARISVQRTQALQQLALQIQGEKQKLQALQVEREQLQQTLLHLRVAPPPKNQHPEIDQRPFSSLRHQLRWPINGSVIQVYGTALSSDGQLRSDGLLIAAKEGQPVRAIASGQVVFSRWLAGYGLLVIIDHGNGYMSLYGRNQSLLVQQGQSVAPGEVVARAGESGGFAKTRLYFAMRHLAKPLDPIAWLRSRSAKRS